MSERRDLNPRPSPWQGDALPLSYFRVREANVRKTLISQHCIISKIALLFILKQSLDLVELH